MTRRAARAWLSAAALVVAVSAAAADIDPATSQIGFTLTTRWGQTLQGRFPQYQGEVVDADAGRHRVRLRLAARAVQILGHPGYTRLTRGGGFFDAARYPLVEFVSDPYLPALLRSGGPLPGTVSIRGIRRREVFVVSPATCAAPARDCAVVASGSIERGDYGMGRWDVALSGRVRFILRVRLRADGDA